MTIFFPAYTLKLINNVKGSNVLKYKYDTRYQNTIHFGGLIHLHNAPVKLHSRAQYRLFPGCFEQKSCIHSRDPYGPHAASCEFCLPVRGPSFNACIISLWAPFGFRDHKQYVNSPGRDRKGTVWAPCGHLSRSCGILVVSISWRLLKGVAGQVTGQNVDKPKRRQPKRRQTKTSTNRNVDRPKRRQTKTSTNRNVDKPKRRQTETSTNQNVDRPKRRQTKTSTDRNVDKSIHYTMCP